MAQERGMAEIDSVLLRLALQLQATRGGMTIPKLQKVIGELKGKRQVTRKTVANYRRALKEVFENQYSDEMGEDGLIRVRLGKGAAQPLIDVRAEDVAELRLAIDAAQQSGLNSRMESLKRLEDQLRSLVPSTRQTAFNNNLMDLLAAEGSAFRPGPRPNIPETTLAELRDAILKCGVTEILYRSRRDGALRWQKIQPYGILVGHRHYLVAYGASKSKPFPHNYVIGNIADIRPTGQMFERRADFDLSAYAARSFGIYQEDPMDIALRFSAARAEDVKEFFFHSSQQVTPLPDGRVEVRFTAGGLVEMAWHLFTWGADVEILEPPALIAQYRQLLEAALATLPPSSG
jgi:predicted DNA-binding transcriptional regulator YafY